MLLSLQDKHNILMSKKMYIYIFIFDDFVFTVKKRNLT